LKVKTGSSIGFVCLPFKAAKLEINSEHHKSDEPNAGREPRLTHSILGSGLANQGGDCSRRFVAWSGDLVKAVSAEGVDVGASLFDGVGQFTQLVVNGIDIEAFGGKLFGGGIVPIPVLVKACDGGIKMLGTGTALGVLFGVLGMAFYTQGARATA
jgi:hypothetical protein